MTKLTQTRTLGSGSAALTVSAVGLGCMGMSEFYGTTDEAQSTETIRRALDIVRRLCLGKVRDWLHCHGRLRQQPI